VTMSPDGASRVGYIELVAMAWKKRLSPMGAPRSVSRKFWFPNARDLTMEGTVFNLLFELDKDCDQMFHQEQRSL
jgi:hypothetical protein